MAWKGPSAAERELSELLRARDLCVSWARIRRWREFGALPWGARRGLGRGAGSVSELTADTAVVAEALALATARKARLEKAVLRVFTVHPRCEDVFVATWVPLPERGVRKALTWYLGQDRSSAVAVVERAVEAVGDDPERRAEAAHAAAHAYYTRRYHQARRMRSAGGGVHPADPHSRADAQGLATLAAAAVLGMEEFGADSVMESLQQSLGSEDDEALSAQAFTEMTAIAAQRELSGNRLADPSWMLTADRARRLRETDYSTICTVRHVLAVLVESALPLRLAYRACLQDPALQHIEQVRTANPRVHHYLDCAEYISRRSPADAWESFTSLLLSICTGPERLEAFQQDVTALDPALDEVHALGRHAAARLAPASAAASRPA
ncbi:hypothetical protein [Streptomyces sp. NBC_01763]|uniref:hypothetical protein n=1 Tax=Streptomyces sp. NBC_01763 TaxID=2975934 RepID=UPI002DD92EB4|nr:hypothetical protein [Streptomyces sp. NBC_01763]WSC34186.1 hypothetical protein OHA08_00555 [Streptomyces sp. NBC_01763]WSC41872.1 hypothetical protein OHA08_44425 [Streptomyces sp. NBC_01763]